jgi:hypothetical protein
MLDSSESVSSRIEGTNLSRNSYLAAKVLLAALGVIVALRIIGVAFAFSRVTGLVAAAVIAIILCLTAHKWVRWIGGVLLFGVINSFIGLVTHHVPTNPRVEVSVGVAALLVAFYAVGSTISFYYDVTHISFVDRLAWLLYLSCMLWPALGATDLSAMTPAVAWSTGAGMAVLVFAFVGNRVRHRNIRRVGGGWPGQAL